MAKTMKIEYDILDYRVLECLCKTIQRVLPSQKIQVNFEEVLDIIQIEDKEYSFVPFVEYISSAELYDYIFKEDDRGINKIWIGLVLEIIFDNGDFIKIDTIKENIELKLKDEHLQNKVKEILL